MDTVDHPLDWWAYGGYPEVMREAECTEAEARRRVRLKLRDYFARTGNPIWRPVGNVGYTALRQAIMEGRVLDNELV